MKIYKTKIAFIVGGLLVVGLLSVSAEARHAVSKKQTNTAKQYLNKKQLGANVSNTLATSTIIITSPINDSVVSNVSNTLATSTIIITSPINNSVVSRVTQFIGAWDTTQYPNGLYFIKAQVQNYQGRVVESSSVRVKVKNSLSVPVLSVITNPSFNAPTYVAGASGVRVGSFKITVSAGEEGVKISSLTFDKDTNSNFDVQNLRAMINGTQFDVTQASVGDTEIRITFKSNPPSILIPGGGSVIVDLYADILTSTTPATHASVFDLNKGSAVGATSNYIVTWPSAANGQNIVVVIVAGPTVTLATDPDNVPASYLVMGSTDNILYKLRLSGNNTEDTKITDITLTDTITNNTAGITSLNNFRLFDDAGQQLAGPVNATLTGLTPSKISFSLGANSLLIVPNNNSRTVILKGDVATFISGAAVSNSRHTLGVASTIDVLAYGKDSNTSATITGTPSGTAQTVYRTKPSLTSTVRDVVTGRTRTAVDEVATLNWTANAADDLTIQKVTMKFMGNALNATATSTNVLAFSVDLLDVNTNTRLGDSQQAVCTPSGVAGCSVTFNPNFTITRSTTKATKVRVNSSWFNNTANAPDSFSAIIDAASNILWSDGRTNNISWEAVQIPLTLVNIHYE